MKTKLILCAASLLSAFSLSSCGMLNEALGYQTNAHWSRDRFYSSSWGGNSSPRGMDRRFPDQSYTYSYGVTPSYPRGGSIYAGGGTQCSHAGALVDGPN